MNLILTTECNKNCSFCFAKQVSAEKTANEMTMEAFKRLIEMAEKDNPPTRVKLLGGEPTMHSQFPEMVRFLEKKNFPAVLISNLLYEKMDIKQALCTAVSTGIIEGVLANAAELDIGNRLSIFKTNYDALLEASALRGPGRITAAITLSRYKTIEEEVNYIDFLAKQIKIMKLRLSLDFQEGNVKDEFFINNKEYGRKILAVVYKCLDLRIPITWDCKLFPCMFDEASFYKDIIGFIQAIRTECGSDDAPFDVFPDLSYIHCYPARALSGEDILKFSRISEALGEISFLKKTLRGMLNCSLPEVCRECAYYKNKKCDSLCLGCQEIPKLGRAND